MGYLLNGQWTDGNPPAEFAKAGSFERIDSIFRDRITADGSSGFPAEAGRYHLYVAHNCPWAHRTMIFRALKKLEGAITRFPVCASRGGPMRRTRNFPIVCPTP
jgi:putative glutathione S-transferase